MKGRSRSRSRGRVAKKDAAVQGATAKSTSVPRAPTPELTATKSSAPPPTVAVGAVSPLRKLLTRMGVGLVMMFSFLAILYSNHWIVLAFVVLVQIMCFRELVAVRFKEVKEQQIPFFRSLSWMAFGIAEFAAYGQEVLRALHLNMWARYHHFCTFGAFVVYFALFVLSLKKKKLYKYQMTQAAWTWMVLLIVVGQAWGTLWSLFKGGIFWFLLPASLIVCNDIWAYFTGLAFGRRFIERPFLPALSPNKTWEGFLGGFAVTLILMPVLVYLWQLPDFWVCPYAQVDHCVRSSIFLPAVYSIAGFQFRLTPVYIHGAVFAIFASLIAPFGGFFASGVKRAFGKKDFDTLFPGHGGVVDRMDCQMITQLFVYTYLRTFVFPSPTSVDSIMSLLTVMPLAAQKEVLVRLSSLVNTP